MTANTLYPQLIRASKRTWRYGFLAGLAAGCVLMFLLVFVADASAAGPYDGHEVPPPDLDSVPVWLYPLPPRELGHDIMSCAHVRLADLDGDGALEVVCAGVHGVFIRWQDNTWTSATRIPIRTMQVGDITGDGVDDVVVSTQPMGQIVGYSW